MAKFFQLTETKKDEQLGRIRQRENETGEERIISPKTASSLISARDKRASAINPNARDSRETRRERSLCVAFSEALAPRI